MNSPQNRVAAEEPSSETADQPLPPAEEPQDTSAAASSTGAKSQPHWLSQKHAILIGSCCLLAAALLIGTYFFFLAPAPQTEPETLAAKTDFLPSPSAEKGSLEAVIGQAKEEPADESSPKEDMMAGAQPPAPSPWMPDRALMSDTKNWVPITKQADFRTFFFKDVNAKGSADAKLAMLTNFSTARALPGTPTAYLSVLYVISVDCNTSQGIPVNVIWNTGKFATGEDIPREMPPQTAKQFPSDDPMFLHACK